ncbi:MAG: hypothetical protein WC661_19235 [Opitutaceae bacterium]|jgi:hypothetical protein
MKNGILFSANHGGIEFLTITPDGGVTSRHRRHDGVIHMHHQQVPVIAELLIKPRLDLQWHAEIIHMPPILTSFFDPPCFVALRGNRNFRYIDFAIPFAPLSDDQVDALLRYVEDIVLLYHDSQVSCHRARQEA